MLRFGDGKLDTELCSCVPASSSSSRGGGGGEGGRVGVLFLPGYFLRGCKDLRVILFE